MSASIDTVWVEDQEGCVGHVVEIVVDERQLGSPTRGTRPRRAAGMMGLQVTFDSHHPGRLCDFWAAALGYVLEPETPQYLEWIRAQGWDPAERPMWEAAALDPHGIRPRLYFQRVAEGKTAKNRMHLDINVDSTVAQEVDRLVELGASVLYEHATGNITMQDPEGNEFCVQGPKR